MKETFHTLVLAFDLTSVSKTGGTVGVTRLYRETGIIQGGKGASSVKQLTAFATSDTVRTMQPTAPYHCRIINLKKRWANVQERQEKSKRTILKSLELDHVS